MSSGENAMIPPAQR